MNFFNNNINRFTNQSLSRALTRATSTFSTKKITLRLGPKPSRVISKNKKSGNATLAPVISSKQLNEFIRLVCIEPNPGPNKKHTHSGASGTKPPTGNFSNLRVNRREIVRLVRKLDRDAKLKAQKDILFQPEAWFEVGIDEQTKEFFTDTANRIAETLGSQAMTHTLALPTFSWRGILEWLLEIPKRFAGFIYGLVKLLFSQCSLPFVQHVLLFLDTLFEVPKGEFKPEFGFGEESWMNSCNSWYESVKEFVTFSSYQRLISCIASAKKTMVNTNSTFEFLSSILRVLVQFLNDTFGLKLPIPGVDSVVTGLSSEADLLQEEFRRGDMAPYEFAQKCFKVQMRMEEVLFSKTGFLDDVSKERLRYLLRRFAPIVKYCEANINPRNGPRIEPLAVLIGGATGVGKSTMTMPLLLDLLVQILPKDQLELFLKSHNDFIFYRANENDFWDGYKSHNVAIVYDDFGQRRDSVGTPNPDAFEMIRLKNTAPYHLHFSDIADKQKHYANPNVLYATTNRRRLHFESIENSRAVVRRFDIAMIQYPKLEFCKEPMPSDYFERKLDIDKVRAVYPYVEGNPDTFVSLDVLEYLEWDYNSGCPALGACPMSFEALVTKCVSKYKETNSRGDNLLQFHEWVKRRAYERLYGPEMALSSQPESDTESEHPLIEDEKSSSALADMVNGWLDEVKHNCGTYFDRAKTKFCICDADQCKCAKYLLYFGVLAVSAWKLASAGNSLFKYFWGGNEPQSESVMSQRSPNGKVARKGISRKQAIKSARALKRSAQQFSGEISIHHELHNVVEHNTYMVMVEGKVLGQTVFFSSRHFMWPRHFSDKILTLVEVDEDGRWEKLVSFVDKFSNEVAFVLDFNTDITFADPPGDLDLHLLYVNNDKIRLHRDLRKHFLSSKETLMLDHNYDACMELHSANRWYMNSFKLTVGEPVTYEFGDMEYSSRDLLYHTDSSPGDCGSPIFINDPRIRGSRIAGFHVAGATHGIFRKKPCAGVSINREELDNFVNSSMRGSRVLEDDEVPNYKAEACPISNFRVVARAKQPHVATKSKLEASLLYGKLWDITTAPSALVSFERDGEIISPLSLARDKYAHPEVYINSEMLDVNYSFVANLILKKFSEPPHLPRLLTYKEAVCGIEGLEYVDSINRSASAGYPHQMSAGGKPGKTYWYGDGDQFDLDNENAADMEKKVNLIIESARQGYRRFHVFMDCLKDERRPIEKVEAGSTRQFMSCPLDLLLAMRMYFGDFVRHCMQNRIFNGMALGIDPHLEWSTLVVHLMNHGNVNFTAGDYSKFDARIPVAIGYKVLAIIEAFYVRSTEEETWIRRVLFQEIINSRHLSQGFVYEFNGGNPSGQPLTSVYNSIANLLILTYSASMNYRGQVGWECFQQNWMNILKRTRFQTFGDDNIVAYNVNDEKWWGQMALEEHIPKHTGMTYTNEQKSLERLEKRMITEITFLKRGFRYDGVRWRAPLDIDVLKETLNWQTRKSTVDEMRLRIDAVLMEIAQHGRHTFESLAPKIVSASVEHYDYLSPNSEFDKAVDALTSLSL